MKLSFEPTRRQPARPAIFIDRDGVINCKRPNDYVLHWSQFVFTPGIREALRMLSTLELPMIVISNQAAVGKGLLEASELETITRTMHDSLVADGISISAYYYCTHKQTDCCFCRKPRPGLLLEAAADFNIDLMQSIFIGDSASDVHAARSARCAPILFGADVNQALESIGTYSDVGIASSPADLYPIAVQRMTTLSR